MCLQARLRNPKTDELWLAAVRIERHAGNEKAAEAVLAKALQVGGTSGLTLTVPGQLECHFEGPEVVLCFAVYPCVYILQSYLCC
jgi:hypothetical protein